MVGMVMRDNQCINFPDVPVKGLKPLPCPYTGNTGKLPLLPDWSEIAITPLYSHILAMENKRRNGD
jgi:hypothetical protein